MNKPSDLHFKSFLLPLDREQTGRRKSVSQRLSRLASSTSKEMLKDLARGNWVGQFPPSQSEEQRFGGFETRSPGLISRQETGDHQVTFCPGCPSKACA